MFEQFSVFAFVIHLFVIFGSPTEKSNNENSEVLVMLQSPLLANNFGSVGHFHAAIPWPASDTGDGNPAGLSKRVHFHGEACRCPDKRAEPDPGPGNSYPRTKLFKPAKIFL